MGSWPVGDVSERLRLMPLRQPGAWQLLHVVQVRGRSNERLRPPH